jgi:hypothetical protein
MAHINALGSRAMGDDHLVGIFPSGAELAVAFTQAYLGLPTAILDRLGHLLQA